jgi:hypothetical protein
MSSFPDLGYTLQIQPFLKTKHMQACGHTHTHKNTFTYTHKHTDTQTHSKTIWVRMGGC